MPSSTCPSDSITINASDPFSLRWLEVAAILTPFSARMEVTDAITPISSWCITKSACRVPDKATIYPFISSILIAPPPTLEALMRRVSPLGEEGEGSMVIIKVLGCHAAGNSGMGTNSMGNALPAPRSSSMNFSIPAIRSSSGEIPMSPAVTAESDPWPRHVVDRDP